MHYFRRVSGRSYTRYHIAKGDTPLCRTPFIRSYWALEEGEMPSVAAGGCYRCARIRDSRPAPEPDPMQQRLAAWNAGEPIRETPKQRR